LITRRLIAWIAHRFTLLLLLPVSADCALLLWFYHNPDQQAWVVIPIISSLVAFLFLVKANV